MSLMNWRLKSSPFVLNIANRYAKALLLSIENKTARLLVLKELQKISALFEEDGFKIFASKLLSPAIQKEILISLLKQFSLSPPVQNFLFLLVENKRLSCLNPIVQQYQVLLEESARTKRALIVSSLPLSTEKKDSLEVSFKEALGKNTILEYKEDATLLGGVMIYLNNLLIDSSLKTQLTKLATQMKGAE